MDWKVGDWATFDMGIVQIKELRDRGCASVSDGSFETSGMIVNRLRPLTLRNKRIVENFEIYYKRLHEIDGEGGFNYPDINCYFCQLALDAIDGDEAKEKLLYEQAQHFCEAARDYNKVIDGVPLFRRGRRAV